MIENFPRAVGLNPDSEVQTEPDHFGGFPVGGAHLKKRSLDQITHVRDPVAEVGLVPDVPTLGTVMRESMTPDLIFDIGLHRGEDTDFYLRKGFRVVAIEANPDLVSACQTRFGAALQSGRLHIIEGAIADPSAGYAITFFKNENSVWGTIDPTWAERNLSAGWASERIEVERIDINDVFDKFGIPYMVKIDIEGADDVVLQGLELLAEKPQYVSVEAEKTSYEGAKQQIQSLQDLGYRRFRIVQQDPIPGSNLKTRTRNGDRLDYTFAIDASGPFGDDLAGPWLTADAAVAELKRISFLHRMFGDSAPFRYSNIGRALRLLYKIVTGYRGALPGWHDIHASL
jgi:FkbM family methyltransferase